jgi:hypothetical protein
MLHSAKFLFSTNFEKLCAMQHSAESTHNRDFLREFDTEFENILGCLSGP